MLVVEGMELDARISLVQDIGVGYGEDIDHVKYTVLQLMRECPYVISKPEPRVLLIELGDFAKIFRMYGWVEDYSDEFVATRLVTQEC